MPFPVSSHVRDDLAYIKNMLCSNKLPSSIIQTKTVHNLHKPSTTSYVSLFHSIVLSSICYVPRSSLLMLSGPMASSPVDGQEVATPSFFDLLSRLLDSIHEVSSLATSDHSEIFHQFAAYVEKLAPIFGWMRDNDVEEPPHMRELIESLLTELDQARILDEGHSKLRSGGVVAAIESVTHELGHCLGLVLQAGMGFPLEIEEKIGSVQREMVNVKFVEVEAESPNHSSDYDESGYLCAEDAILLLKNSSNKKFGVGLSELSRLVADDLVSDGLINDKGVIPILLNRMGSAKHHHRLRILVFLRKLTSKSNQYKESMEDVGHLSLVVRSLARDAAERREAVGLLLSLSESQQVRQRLGKIQGCIVMLVSLLNGEDSSVSDDAKELLSVLSFNKQNVLHMAEAGYFKPLVRHLENGSDMTKILMATGVLRMELTDQSKAALGEDGAIEALVNMFNSGKVEAKLSSLTALQSLSTLKENVQRLINTKIVHSLLRLLFSVTSGLMTLREPASAILASIADSKLILINQNVVQQMLSLLNLSNPVVQYHLLKALNSIASHPGAEKARSRMRECGAIQPLLPFLTDKRIEARTAALNYLFNISKDKPEDLVEELGDSYLKTITSIILSSSSELEMAAAVGIISIIPVCDKKTTEIVKNMDLLLTLISFVATSGPSPEAETRSWLLENIAGLLVRFTVSSDKKLQRYSAEAGIIPCLLKILPTGSPIAKVRIATALGQMSQNTSSLSKVKSSKWICIPPSSDAYCEVHDGYCSVRSTFCLVKAGAISPLIQVLEGKEREADEAVLGALSTLLKDETWENGSKAIENASGLQAIIKILEQGTGKAIEKVVWMLERIFRVESHRLQYGASAQVLLIDLAQRDDPVLKPMVAKVLAHLQLLQMQSSYF